MISVYLLLDSDISSCHQFVCQDSNNLNTYNNKIKPQRNKNLFTGNPNIQQYSFYNYIKQHY